MFTICWSTRVQNQNEKSPNSEGRTQPASDITTPVPQGDPVPQPPLPTTGCSTDNSIQRQKWVCFYIYIYIFIKPKHQKHYMEETKGFVCILYSCKKKKNPKHQTKQTIKKYSKQIIAHKTVEKDPSGLSRKGPFPGHIWQDATPIRKRTYNKEANTFLPLLNCAIS